MKRRGFDFKKLSFQDLLNWLFHSIFPNSLYSFSKNSYNFSIVGPGTLCQNFLSIDWERLQQRFVTVFIFQTNSIIQKRCILGIGYLGDTETKVFSELWNKRQLFINEVNHHDNSWRSRPHVWRNVGQTFRK